MRQIVPDVYLVEGLRGGNVYLLTSGEGLILVDSGLTGEVNHIVDQMQEQGFVLSQLHTIVLTHAHGDHAGGVTLLASRSGAKTLAHRDEVPYIEGTKTMPMASLPERLLNWMGERIIFRRVPCKVDRILEEGDAIESLDGMIVIHTPGHTPGSICLYQPERRILFCGDALLNANPMTGRPAFSLPLRMVTVNNVQARDSVRKLSALSVDVLCFGHGEPILGGVEEKIGSLLKES
jgi:glyoxylase-like metal-dependent hydrolase (beta-lactamase superfamily II)